MRACRELECILPSHIIPSLNISIYGILVFMYWLEYMYIFPFLPVKSIWIGVNSMWGMVGPGGDWGG